MRPRMVHIVLALRGRCFCYVAEGERSRKLLNTTIQQMLVVHMSYISILAEECVIFPFKTYIVWL